MTTQPAPFALEWLREVAAHTPSPSSTSTSVPMNSKMYCCMVLSYLRVSVLEIASVQPALTPVMSAPDGVNVRSAFHCRRTSSSELQ